MNLHTIIIDDFWLNPDYLSVRKELFSFPSKKVTVANTVEEVVDFTQVAPKILKSVTTALEVVVHDKIQVKIAYLRKTAGSRVYHNVGVSQFGAVLFFSNYGGVTTVVNTAAGLWRAPVDEQQQYVYEHS